MPSTPAVSAGEGVGERLDARLQPELGGVAGRELVAAAAELAGDPADVDAALGAQRDLPAALTLLLEHGRDLAGGVGAHDVDEPLGLDHPDPPGLQVGQG